MSEVTRYLIQKTPIGTMMKPNPGGNWVGSEDFDRITAERDALQQRLTETDQRADDLQTRLEALEQRRRVEFEAGQVAEKQVEVVLPDVCTLSNIIRKVDGNHSLGAGALAEAIIDEVARLNQASKPICCGSCPGGCVIGAKP